MAQTKQQAVAEMQQAVKDAIGSEPGAEIRYAEFIENLVMSGNHAAISQVEYLKRSGAIKMRVVAREDGPPEHLVSLV